MKKIISLALTLFLILPMYVKAETEEINIYVSPRGNDMSNGAFSSPLATIEGARRRVREYIKYGKNINVNFFGGEYEVKNTAVFEAKDSAADGTKITYKAYNDEKVTFRGSHIINQKLFMPVEDKSIRNRLQQEVRDKIGCMDLKAAGIDELEKYIPPKEYMQTVVSYPKLYLDDNEQQLSRWPNVGYNTIEKVLDNGAIKRNGDLSGRPAIIGYKSPNIDRWTAAKDAIIEGIFCNEYAFERLYIKEVNPSERTITTDGSTVYGVAEGKRWAAVNLMEEIDIPGEYYIDIDNMKLYYYPPYGIKDGKLEITTLTKPMMTGENVHGLVFENLSFEKTRARVGEFNNCYDITFDGCSIKNIGHQALNMQKVSKININGCRFDSVGGTCIYIEGGDRTTLTGADNHIENNTFYKMGRETKTYAGAVDIYGVGTYVERNIMHEAPHQVIRFSGNNHKIRYNEIYNAVKETLDSSAVYCGRDYTMWGNEIAYNYIHDIKSSANVAGLFAAGVYLDDMWSGTNVHHNIFVNTDLGVLANGGRNNTINSNIFANCDTSIYFVNSGETWAKASTLPGGDAYKTLGKVDYMNPPYSVQYPELPEISKDLAELGSPKNNTICDNLIYKCPETVISDSVYKFAKKIENNIETDEAEFNNPENGDYTIKKDSDILNKLPEIGEINISEIGLTSDEDRLDIDKFKLIYPKNGQAEINNVSQLFMWDYADEADYFELTIAKDSGFNEVVYKENTRYNYAVVKGLESGNIKYYWKVTARNYSRQMPAVKENMGAAYLCKTPLWGYVDTDLLNSNMETALNLANTITEGDGIGEYPEGSKQQLADLVDLCNALKKKKNVLQQEIDDYDSRLQKKINEVKISAKSGYVSVPELNADEWSGSAEIAFSDNIMKIANGVASSTYEYTGCEMLCFDMKTDYNGKWSGFALKQNRPKEYVYSNSGDAYLVVVKEDIIELQRFRNGISKFLATVPNKYIGKGEWSSIQFGAFNVKKGVRLILNINGENVFDYTDKKNAITSNGHITFYDVSGNNGLQIRKTEKLPDEEFDLSREINYPEPEILKGLFTDKSLWTKDGSWFMDGDISVDENGIKATGTHFVTNSILPVDSVIKFKAKFNLGTSWQALSIRNSTPTVMPWNTGANNYLIAFKPKSIEVQKFIDDKNEYIAIFENTYMKSGEWHDYEITTRKAADGVRIIFKIDDNVLLDYVDEYAVMSAGYMGFYDFSKLGMEIKESQ